MSDLDAQGQADKPSVPGPVPARDAATIMLVRDAADELRGLHAPQAFEL